MASTATRTAAYTQPVYKRVQTTGQAITKSIATCRRGKKFEKYNQMLGFGSNRDTSSRMLANLIHAGTNARAPDDVSHWQGQSYLNTVEIVTKF